MDLEPFSRINPCGYEGLQVCSVARCLPDSVPDMDKIGRRLMTIVAQRLE
jgi:lipoyl(octanoyl) transferase